MEEAFLHEEGLVDVLHRLALLTDARGDGVQSHGAAAELLEDGEEDLPVHRVEPAPVHLQPLQRPRRHLTPHPLDARHLGEVADPPQESVGDAGRSSGAGGDLLRPVLGELHPEDAGAPDEDRLEVRRRVVVEPLLDLEPVAQRRGEKPGAGGRPDQVKGGRSIFIARAAGPESMVMSSRKSSIAG